MFQKFDAARNFYANVDQHGVVRELLHTDAPVATRASAPQLAAAEYLHWYGGELGLSPQQLQSLGKAASTSLEAASIEYRFNGEKRQFDTATAAFDQTKLGLPVWQAGIAVQMLLDPPRILSAQSTRHPDFEVTRPSDEAVKHAESIDEKERARLLGLTEAKALVFSGTPRR